MSAFDKVDGTVDRWYIVPVEGTWEQDELEDYRSLISRGEGAQVLFD